MHSIFEARTTLRRINSGFGFAGKQIFHDNCIVIGDDINVIDTDCFSSQYIGLGGPLIFKGFVCLEPRSITSPLITDIVFEGDASISEDAFFSKTANSEMYNNYTLFCRMGSAVEKFAKSHGFRFRTLNEFNKPDSNACNCLTYNEAKVIIIKNHSCFLSINADGFVFCKRAEKRNANYVFYQSPFIKDSFKESADGFMDAFQSIATKREKEKYDWVLPNRILLEIFLNKRNAKKYLSALEIAFKDKEIEKYIMYFVVIK